MAKVLFCLPSNRSAFLVCERVLRGLGHQVRTFFYRERANPERTRVTRLLERLRPVDHVARMNRDLIEEARAFRPDVLLVFKGEIIFPETIRLISRELGATTASYYVDSPLWPDNSTLHILYGLQCFDVAFVFDGHYAPEMRRLGCRRVEVLPFACEPTVHRPVELAEWERQQFGSAVCFVGNYQGGFSGRERILGELLEFDVRIWGEGWEHCENAAVKSRWTGRSAAGDDLARVYSASAVTLNITYPHSITQPNMRTFEAPACGILLINDHLDGLSQFFEIGREIEVYHDVTELKEKIEYYLDRPAQRQELAAAGHARAHRDHTYEHRMRQMMRQILEERCR
jgi:spore maturation protein CgeB